MNEIDLMNSIGPWIGVTMAIGIVAALGFGIGSLIAMTFTR